MSDPGQHGLGAGRAKGSGFAYRKAIEAAATMASWSVLIPINYNMCWGMKLILMRWLGMGSVSAEGGISISPIKV